MEHLMREEIMRFAKIDRMEPDVEVFVRGVHRHIMECPSCAAAVRGAIEYYDTLSSLSAEDFSLRDLYLSAVNTFEEKEEKTYDPLRN